MLYCPKCGCSLKPSLDKPDWVCEQCAWSFNGVNVPEQKDKNDKLILELPPIGLSHVRESRYLTHCTNIARIIVGCKNTYDIRDKVKEYLRITKEEVT